MLSDRAKILQKRTRLLAEMVSLTHAALMRGSIVERTRRCGRKNCVCAQDPTRLHKGQFLTVQIEGKTQAMHLRAEDIAPVSKAVQAYQRLWEIINGLTECELSDLKRQTRERQRVSRRRKLGTA